MIATQLADLRRLTETPIEFIAADDFEKPNAQKVMLAAPPIALPKRNIRPSKNEFGAYLGDACRLPLLTAEEERYYFRRMNFLKWRAEKNRLTLSKTRPSASKLKRIEDDILLATEDFHYVVEHNLRLVIPLAIKAERHGIPVWDGISEGNTALMRAVKGFDYSRGFRFSTYATWAIKRSLQTYGKRSHRDSRRFTPTENERMTDFPEDRESATAEELRHKAAAATVTELLDTLDQRSQSILRLRFGLKVNDSPMTLKDVGARFGVSKERVRQIEVHALKSLQSQVRHMIVAEL